MSEEKLEEIVSQSMDTNGVVGSMIIDSDGLCLASRGKTNTLLGGPISELTNLAAKLCNNENPSIVLETDSCNLLIKREGTITAAVYKQVS